MKNKIKILDTESYKIGLNEIEGLKKTLREVVKPIQDALKNKIYWNECIFEESDYLGRDGFIPYSHNCGGLEFTAIIPKCEEYDFNFLEFGEHDEDCNLNKKGEECTCGEHDGHLDAKLRVWLKFEGLDESNKLNFYLVLSGGNGDAPYFREKYSSTIFEADFTASSVKGVKRAASKHVKALLKTLGEK
jgi:hypothetical protein